MADAVATQTLRDDGRLVVMKFTNISDGTGESAVTKVDVSALAVNPITGEPCTSVSIQRIQYDVRGMDVKILWDADTDVLCYNVKNPSRLTNQTAIHGYRSIEIYKY